MDDVGVRGRKPDVSLSGGDGLVTEHRRIGLILRVKGEAAAGGFVCGRLVSMVAFYGVLESPDGEMGAHVNLDGGFFAFVEGGCWRWLVRRLPWWSLSLTLVIVSSVLLECLRFFWFCILHSPLSPTPSPLFCFQLAIFVIGSVRLLIKIKHGPIYTDFCYFERLRIETADM